MLPDVAVAQAAQRVIYSPTSPILKEARRLMTLIQIPDDEAAALQAKAAAQGLTLEAWLRNLAGLEEPQSCKGHYRLADLVAQCDPTAPFVG